MKIHFLIPGDIRRLTGGNVFDLRLIEGLSTLGHEVSLYELSQRFPFPAEDDIRQCRSIFSQITENEPIIIDSLAFAPLAPVLREFSKLKAVIAIMHLPLGMSPDLSPVQRQVFAPVEKKALQAAHYIVVTSGFTAEYITKLDASLSGKIKLILPGLAPVKRKEQYPELPAELLCIGSYLPNKSYHLLPDTLSQLTRYNWKLNCYGEILNESYFETLKRMFGSKNLRNRVSLHAPISGEELHKAYLNADLLIHPSSFESFGMVPAEALNHGIPVIVTTGGALPDTIPASMGRSFSPGDTQGLVTILKQLFEDKSAYRRLCQAAAKYHLQAFQQDDSIRVFVDLINHLNVH